MTIGVFDGLHQGHRSLIDSVISQKGMIPWVITFNNNPKKILQAGKFPGDIMLFSEKLAALERLGVQAAVMIDFSEEFGKLIGADFMSLICEHCGLSSLSVGKDFRLGYRMDTDAEKIRKFYMPQGIAVNVLPSVYYGEEKISSTLIRGLIQKGDFSSVQTLLRYQYSVSLNGVYRNTEKSVFKSEISQVLPQKGIYPVFFEESGRRYAGEVDIDESAVSWHYNGKVEAITFV